jgi:tol-pal system protein YbgF
MTRSASAPKSVRVMLVIASLAVGPALVGCGASTAPAPSAAGPDVAEGSGGEVAVARLEQLETEATRRERRIRELESRLALADAQVRDLRSEAEERETESYERPVVRIGDTERPAPRVREVEEPVEEEAPAEDAGPRPVLRLYGPPELPQVAYAPPVMDPSVAHAMPAAVMPQYVPAPPTVAGLGPLPVVAPPGMRSMVPPIPDRPVTVLPAPPAPMLGAAPGLGGAGASGHRTADDPSVREYQAALAHVAARRFDEALAGLTGFLHAHPQHPYADNAMYWRGEVLYMRRDYAAAERELAEMVRRFPHGNKVPDALLRLGFCRQRQGDLDGARTYFRRVRAEHPGTVAARLASREDT